MPRVAHIADLHLSVAEPHSHGIDLWDHFERVLDAVVAEDAELIVIGGDLALKDGDEPTYRRIARTTENLPVDVIVQPGNHDRPSLFEGSFGRRYRWTGSPLDRVVTWRNHCLVFLDSATGELLPEQLAWLESVWATCSPAALFVHHPVAAGICLYMEEHYELAERDRVIDRISRLAQEVHVFSGHYHVSYDGRERSVVQHVTPAVFYQLDPHIREFRIASREPGYRIIDFEPEGLTTRTKFVR